MKTRWLVIAVVVLCGIADTTHGNVSFDWATVGNPGNGRDETGFGAVSYVYRISKHEVTNDQYAEFLNAVDPMGTNPNSVYSSSRASDQLRSGIAFDLGAASGAKYSTRANMGNKPVNYVSFLDSMRFVNWLENGQPTGGSGTESGVYAIGNGLNETRATGATFSIPSENEWYKAAYHQPAVQGGDADNYWLYPTASNSVPTIATANSAGDIDNPGANVANYRWVGLGGPMTVGSAGPLSASFYGTFDQGGNVYEWTEAVIKPITPQGTFRGWRGGSWCCHESFLRASHRNYAPPTEQGLNIGFRVASVQAPSLPGDFNDNGVLDTNDINDLTTWSATGKNPTEYDLDNDSLVNDRDVNLWVNDFFKSWIGDANLDREFNSMDLIDVLASGTYEADVASVWTTGDFNGDGRTNSSDLVAALAEGGYELGPRSASPVVPEPSAVSLLLSLAAMLGCRWRRIR